MFTDSEPWCADTAMWVRVAVPISVIPVLVCSLPIVTSSVVIPEDVKPKLQVETCCSWKRVVTHLQVCIEAMAV